MNSIRAAERAYKALNSSSTLILICVKFHPSQLDIVFYLFKFFKCLLLFQNSRHCLILFHLFISIRFFLNFFAMTLIPINQTLIQSARQSMSIRCADNENKGAHAVDWISQSNRSQVSSCQHPLHVDLDAAFREHAAPSKSVGVHLWSKCSPCLSLDLAVCVCVRIDQATQWCVLLIEHSELVSVCLLWD